jgi:hypothetical protein
MKQTKNKRKLALNAETIKLLDPRRLGEAAGGKTFGCTPSTTNGTLASHCTGC